VNSNPTLAVIAFPGNNSETETARAARKSGFEAEIIRWNEVEKIGHYQAYVLPGGFSFEDRGRSGAIAAREPIFKALRAEAQAGKVILGICNGAQMVVESGLIPVDSDPLPFALADNVRRDQNDHVMGTGYFNAWCAITPERTDTAFSQNTGAVLKVPVAHGEGRFTTNSTSALKALQTGSHVAFRYADETGQVAAAYPDNPNGATAAVAMIVNKEGTIGAIMPHPERYPLECDGDQIFASMYQWITNQTELKPVTIGDLSAQTLPTVTPFEVSEKAIVLEKTLIITDNEGFSVNQAAQNLLGEAFSLEKSFVYVIEGAGLSEAKLAQTGLIANPNKETLEPYQPKPQQLLVELYEDDPALHLADQLTEQLKTPVKVRRLKAWNFPKSISETQLELILKNGLLCNPNSGALYRSKPA
jgi:phosphoribosylformylglycinamidine synthase